MISQYPKTDREKLIGLRDYIWKNYKSSGVVVEPFMVFSKGEDEFQYFAEWLSNEEVTKFNTFPCDLLLIINGKRLVFELDGPIHDIKTEKTDKRNKRYELNNLPYIVINESELKLKLAIPKSRKLTQDQINKEFKERFDNMTKGVSSQ